MAPLAVGRLPGVVELTQGLLTGHPAHSVGVDEAFGLTLSADVFAVLAAGLLLTLGRTVVARRRHRLLLDLVGRASSEVPGTVLLDDPRAAAYCLPGLRSRIVVASEPWPSSSPPSSERWSPTSAPTPTSATTW